MASISLTALGTSAASRPIPNASCAGLERLQADGRVDVGLLDQVRRLLGDLLDLHAALGAGHHDGAAGRPVDDDAEVELLGHLEAFLDEHARDDAAFGAGLVRDQRHADDGLGELLGLVGRLGELDAAALAAAAGVDLRLDDDGAAAEALGDLRGLGGVERDLAARHGDAVPREDLLGLILVDFHGGWSAEGRRA